MSRRTKRRTKNIQKLRVNVVGVRNGQQKDSSVITEASADRQREKHQFMATVTKLWRCPRQVTSPGD